MGGNILNAAMLDECELFPRVGGVHGWTISLDLTEMAVEAQLNSIK